MIQNRPAPRGLKYLLSGPIQKKFAQPCSERLQLFRPESPPSLCCELIFKHDGEVLSGIAATQGFLTCTPRATEMQLTMRRTGGTNSSGERTLRG